MKTKSKLFRTGTLCALAQLTTFAQDATTTVGWWPEGSDPRVVAERSGGSTLEMIVRRGGKADRGFTVHWETTDTGTATPGSDFIASGGTLTFAAGEAENAIQISILDDGLLEYPETVGLRLFDASSGVAINNAATQAVIFDNEIPPTLDLAPSKLFGPPPPVGYNLTTVLPDTGMLQLELGSGRLLRFAPDGALTSYSSPISVRMDEIQEHALLATHDNKAILSGTFTEVNGIARPGIVRLLLDGTVDDTFTPPPDLKSSDFLRLLNVQRDGRILLQLGFKRMIRLHENGSLDQSFIGLESFVYSALELTSGAILVRTEQNCWFRLLPNGSVDLSFQPAINDCTANPFEMPDGSVVWTNFRKMKPDGSLDEGFHVPTWISTLGPALPDGRLIASGAYTGGRRPDATTLFGWSTFFVILRPDGSIDESHPGFVVRSDSNRCGQQIAPISESTGIVHGCVGSINGHGPGTRVPLRGPFKNLLYSSSIIATGIFNSDTRAVITVFRAGATTSAASVRYHTRDGTGTAGRQYVAASGQVTFAPLENIKTVEVDLLPQSEFTETFEVVLEDPVGAEIAQSPITVSMPGRQPRFAAKPIQFVVNDSPVISVLEPNYKGADGKTHRWALESSKDLKEWSEVTGTVTWGGFAYDLFTLDFSGSMQPQRFYRLRIR